MSPLSSLTLPCLIQPPPFIVLLLVGCLFAESKTTMPGWPFSPRSCTLHGASFGLPTNQLRRLFTHLHMRELKEWMFHCCGVRHSSHTALLIGGSLVCELFFPCSLTFMYYRLCFLVQCGFCCRLSWFSSMVHCPVISHR